MPSLGNLGDFDAGVKLNTKAAEEKLRRLGIIAGKTFDSRSGLGRATAQTKDFEKTLGAATNRVVAFGAAAVVFNTLSRSVGAFVKSLVEVDKNLAEINVNLNQSAAGLKQFGGELFNIARQTGQTFETAAKAATELARQGLSAEETIKRLKDALILSRISGLDSADAVNTLTAAINSFNQEALTSTEIVNKFAAVDTKFAVSSKDLAEAVSRVGSTAQSAGVGLDELIGLVTSLQQTTARGGAVIGNGLKTIFTRVQAAPETVAALQSVGVAIKDTEGNLRSAIDILRDYGRAREKLGEAERAGLDRTVAGTFQINVLKAALADLSKGYSVYDNALKTSVGATDEAIRKNEQLNRTLSSLINSTAVSLKQLVAAIGDQDLSPSLRGLLEFVETARKYLSGDTGDKLGESLGNGILRGITNVLSGPVLVGATAILYAAFKKVFSTIREETRTLLNQNSAAAARARVQERINGLLQNATLAEKAQLDASRSVAQQKEILIAIQSRLNRELLIGTELQNSLISRGTGGTFSVSPQLSRKNLGKIPPFADPIASAIQKESTLSGLSKSQIYVDKDPRVATFANPQGLLVANRRDEPLGGFQGVNRVISQGGNPKMGSVPGFALSSQETLALQNIAARPGGLEGFVKGLDLSKVDFDVQARKVRKQILGAVEDALNIDTSKLAPVAKRSYSRLVTEILTERSPEIERLKSAQIERRNIETPRSISRFEREAQGIRIVGTPPAQSPEEVRRAPTGNPYVPPPALAGELGRRRMGKTPEEYVAERRANAIKRAQAQERNRNRAFGLAFLAPFAGGFVEQGFQNAGVSTRGGTAGGIASGALQGASQGAALGVFGPVAGGIGATIGALKGIIDKSTQSLEEFNQVVDDGVAAQQSSVDAITRVVSITSQLGEDGLRPEAAQRFVRQRAEAIQGVDPEFRSALSRSDITPEQQAEILAKAQEKVARATRVGEVQKGARALNEQGILEKADKFFNKTLGRLPSALLFGGDIGGATKGARMLTENQFSGVDRAREIGKNISGQLSAENVGNIDRSLLNRLISGRGQSGDVDKLSQTYKKLGIDVEITSERQIEFAEALRTAVVQFKDLEKIISTIKAPAAGGLLSNAFVNPANTDVFRNASATNRNPLAGQTQRGQAQFGLFNELVSAGAVKEEVLKSNPLYSKSKATSQVGNASDALIKYLEGAGYNTSQLKSQQGDPRLDSIKRLLDQSSRSGSSNAEQSGYLSQFVDQMKATLAQAGVTQKPAFTEGLSGYTPGGNYGAFDRSRKRGGAGYINSSNLRQNLPADSTDYITSANLKYNLPASRGGFDLTKESATVAADQPKKTLDVNVNIDGALNLIANGMNADLAVAINTKVNQAVVDATAEYFKQVQPELAQLRAQLASINGKPLPPTVSKNQAAPEMALPAAAAIRSR